MAVDQGSLFIAAGIGGGALALTMLSGWLHNRADRFLISWIVGMGLLSAGVILYSVSPPHRLVEAALAFGMQTAGFIVILVGARQFVGRPTRRLPILAAAATVPLIALPILAGFNGAGIALFNFVAGALLIAAAAQYWAARDEAPAAIAALSVLYLLSGASFFACGVILVHEADWVLTLRPDNRAEQFNAVMCIVGITGIGALSLSLSHARAARRHRDEARADALTGLLNRRALFDTMQAEPLRPGHAVVLFDLDNFKAINDRYGHAGGDEMLRRFAGVLRRNLRGGDLAARIGGEEFVLVLRGASPQLATGTAECIRSMFAAEKVETGKGLLSGTTSAGVALAGDGPESFEAALHRADVSLYRAKDGGRNRVAAELKAVA